MQDTGLHVPNLVVGMTEEDALPQIFRGENCMEQFLEWLEQLTEQDTRYVTALAHNFKGFVVKRLIERKQKFKPTRTGGKLLELTYRGVGTFASSTPCRSSPWLWLRLPKHLGWIPTISRSERRLCGSHATERDVHP